MSEDVWNVQNIYEQDISNVGTLLLQIKLYM